MNGYSEPTKLIPRGEKPKQVGKPQTEKQEAREVINSLTGINHPTTKGLKKKTSLKGVRERDLHYAS
jgi:hypothetical protein